MDELHYHLAFSHFLGIGPMRFAKLKELGGSVRKAYTAKASVLQKVLPPSLAEKFIEFRNRFDPVQKEKEIRQKQIQIIHRESELFPQQLRDISDSPICLYVRGKIEMFDFAKMLLFGVVGTRKPTSYGQYIAKQFSSALCGQNICVVSGMAMGVDTLAHKAAVDQGKRTIAVLGCGVDIIYPPINKPLYEQIIETGGLVISEFPPGHTVLPGLFVARNRIISGLSQGILVVEGTKDSGSLITARYAAEQGKEVFAPPVPITSSLSEAPNILLKQGAHLVTSPDDILSFYSIAGKSRLAKPEMNEKEQAIYDVLEKEAQSIDEIAMNCALSFTELMAVTSNMEVRGIIRKNGAGGLELV
jgi:DNA processing protein